MSVCQKIRTSGRRRQAPIRSIRSSARGVCSPFAPGEGFFDHGDSTMATLETEIAPAAPGTAQEERNRAMALRWFAAMNRGELEVVYELFAESYVLHVANGPEGVFGPAVIRGVIEAYRAAFPDLAFTV